MPAKAKELGLDTQTTLYADVMRTIHPTKWKVCQICGREMSLYYHYPNAAFLKALNAKFGTTYSDCDHIRDIWEDLLSQGVRNGEIARFLIRKGGLSLPESASQEEILDALEYACRKGSKACLGPGAMSNFPDRYDGFHSYNRCCRATQDKGRSRENLKSYTKDRRAYEYWSDGNIHAANQFMGSAFFDGISADHIGPISLGFVHDPRYLQPMESGDNSAKRDRLQQADIEKIIETERRTGVYPMSWYSRIIWEYIKANYAANPTKIGGPYRDALKQNMTNFMYILWYILEHCPENGEDYLVSTCLAPNFPYFSYSYTFNARGEILQQVPRHHTERSRNEAERYQRIAIEAVCDYMEKDNRNLSPDLLFYERQQLDMLCDQINAPISEVPGKEPLVSLLDQIQRRLICNL